MVYRLPAAAALICLFSATALAQQLPATTAAPVPTARCTGLFCDAYYAGKPLPAPGQPDVPSPTSLPCRDFICAAFGGRTAEPPPAAATVAPEPIAEPGKPAKHRRKVRKVASAENGKTEASESEAAKTETRK